MNNIESINPENVHKSKIFVRCLMQGLESLPEYDRINLLEQATAFEQLAQELRVTAAANARSRDLDFWVENAIG